MDHAVTLVQANLLVNAYSTVAEYPVVETMRPGLYQTVTDLDVLAFRFPYVGHRVLQHGKHHSKTLSIGTDPVLVMLTGQSDMLIAEAKEGRAELNRGARNPEVLPAALTRSGCCSSGHVKSEFSPLLRHGRTTTTNGHRVRVAAFGSTVGESGACHIVTPGRVIDYFNRFLKYHRDVLHHAQIKDPGLGSLMTLEKAQRTE
ncbi:MAG: hypothetical protein ACC641_00465 [Acidiferrobacterales bacterium]